jgi:ABC-2 type transport system ATP-binding protein
MLPAGPDLSTRSPTASFAVQTQQLTKRFGERTVVDQVDLAIPTGSVCGFVGPNGAGKTTTIRMLLGLVRPTSGGGSVLGRPLTDPPSFLRRVGALIEAPAFYPSLSAVDNLLVLARLGGVDRSAIEPTLQRVGLADRAADSFRSYSLGMKQRLGIAAALLVTPSLLLLDEPTNGLDPGGILEMRGLVRSLADDGITVFISSHLLAEVEQICDHLVMIRNGRLVFQGSVTELYASQNTEMLMRPEHEDQTAALVRLVAGVGLSARLDRDLNSIVVEADASWAARLNRLAMNADITLVQLDERHRSLEEAFFTLTGTHSGDGQTSTLGEIQ